MTSVRLYHTPPVLGTLQSPVAGRALCRGCPVQTTVAAPDLQGVVVSVDPLDIAWENSEKNVFASFGVSRGRCYSPGWDPHLAAMVQIDTLNPLGRDCLTRWLGVHYGLAVGLTAPTWSFERTRGGAVYRLAGAKGEYRDFEAPDKDSFRDTKPDLAAVLALARHCIDVGTPEGTPGSHDDRKMDRVIVGHCPECTRGFTQDEVGLPKCPGCGIS